MSIESQIVSEARHAELTRRARWNICGKCSGDLVVIFWATTYYLKCNTCGELRFRLTIKPRPTSAELVAKRIAKMEAAAAKPTSKYDIDNLFKEE